MVISRLRSLDGKVSCDILAKSNQIVINSCNLTFSFLLIHCSLIFSKPEPLLNFYN
eukprot:UN10188